MRGTDCCALSFSNARIRQVEETRLLCSTKPSADTSVELHLLVPRLSILLPLRITCAGKGYTWGKIRFKSGGLVGHFWGQINNPEDGFLSKQQLGLSVAFLQLCCLDKPDRHYSYQGITQCENTVPVLQRS